MWLDELFQLSIVDRNFIDVIKCLPYSEYSSYLSGDHYLIFTFLKLFGYNKWALASVHIVATIIGFYLLYLICKLYYKTIIGYLVTFTVVCFNATLLKHATEIRCYAVLPTLALAVFYLFQKLADKPTPLSRKNKILVTLFLIATIWFHPYGVLMIISSLAFHLLRKWRTQDFKGILCRVGKIMSVSLCIAMPLWLFTELNLRPLLETNTFQFIPNPLYNPVGFLKGIFGNLVGFKKLYFLLVGVIFPFIIRYKERILQVFFQFVLIFIPIGLILSADVMRRYWFIQRQFVWVIPFFAFYLGWAWESFILHSLQALRKIRYKGK